jgi:hypothetical protein
MARSDRFAPSVCAKGGPHCANQRRQRRGVTDIIRTRGVAGCEGFGICVPRANV